MKSKSINTILLILIAGCLNAQTLQMDKYIVDFKDEFWKENLLKVYGYKINNLEFLNYQDRCGNEIPLQNFPSFKNITFRGGVIAELPIVIVAQNNINLLSFVEIEIRGSLEKLKEINDLKRLQLCGEKMELFPESILYVSGLEVLFIWKTSIVNLNYNFGKLRELRQLSLRTNKKLESLPTDLHKCKDLNEIELFGCDNMKELEIERTNTISEIRLGSWSDKYEIPHGLANLAVLKRLKIDNYRNEFIELEFIQHLDELESIDISKLSEENIEVVSSKTAIRQLDIGHIPSQRKPHIPLQFKSLKGLEKFEFGNIKDFKISNIVDILSTLENLKIALFHNSSWSDDEITDIKKRFSKINLMIY